MTGEYYLNGPDLASSTGVYMNAEMTVCAPDGRYQQGGIVRQMVDCVLLPEQVCDGCSFPCGPYTGLGQVESGEIGVYIMNIDVGEGTGAIVVRANPQIIPKGFIARYNSTLYNEFSSPTYGYLAAPLTEVTYLGDEYFDCGLVDDSPHTLDVYRFDGTDFVISSGETQSINVTSGQLELTADDPGECVMVIPKVSATPSVVEVSIIAPCGVYPPVDFDVTVECVAELQSYASSVMNATSEDACALAVDQTYYVLPVNGDGSELGLYDWVFSDINGQNPLPDGYYYAPVAAPGGYNYYGVENGVVTDIDICIEDVVLGFVISEAQPGACVLNTRNLRLRIWRGVIPVLDQAGPTTGSINTITGTYLARFDVTYEDNTAACCDVEMVIDIDGDEIATLNIGQPPAVGFTDYVLQQGFVLTQTGTITAFVRCA